MRCSFQTSPYLDLKFSTHFASGFNVDVSYLTAQIENRLCFIKWGDWDFKKLPAAEYLQVHFSSFSIHCTFHSMSSFGDSLWLNRSSRSRSLWETGGSLLKPREVQKRNSNAKQTKHNPETLQKHSRWQSQPILITLMKWFLKALFKILFSILFLLFY